VTHRIAKSSAITLGLAAFVSLSPLVARADTSPPAPASSTSTPAPSPAAPSLAEPAPTPGWAESGPGGPTVAQHATVRHYPRHYTRHYAWRNGHRYYSDNPVASAATGVAGGIADLGSIAAYPFYCFPNYGSCSVRVPYRY
jgi:hypothetical protein